MTEPALGQSEISAGGYESVFLGKGDVEVRSCNLVITVAASAVGAALRSLSLYRA